MSVVGLSVAELSLLPMKTEMKSNLFDKRRKQQSAAAKRAKQPTLAVKSPRTQHLENQARLKEFSKNERQRVQQQRVSVQEEDAKRQKRAADAREDQRVAMERAEQLRDEKQAGSQDGEGSSSPARKKPVKRATPRATPLAAPRAEPQLPRPVFVDLLSYASVSTYMAQPAPESVARVKQLVSESFETTVLCAPYPDGQIRAWSELAQPLDAELRTDYEKWSSPSAWASMADEYAGENPKRLVSLAKSGNYNNILKVSTGTPVADSAAWPPQLTAMGIGTDVPRSEVLPQADYVIRITRTDAFPSKSSSPQVFRSMTAQQVVDEIALSLLAGAQGVGPPVYAAVVWKWNSTNASDSQPKYGMTMVLRESSGDMNFYVQQLREQFPRTTEGPSRGMMRMAEETAVNTVGLCFHLAMLGLINFDMKPANLLMREKDAMFYLSDFDGILCRAVDPEDGGVKTCFFVNLLMLCFHVQTYVQLQSGTFTASFLAAAAPVLIELWTEAVRSPSTFGPGAEWLKKTPITADEDEGVFDQGELARLQPKQALSTQLKMMIFEYGFSTRDGRQPPEKIKRFKWDFKVDFFSGAAALVPQVMRYVVLYMSDAPEEFADLFAARPPESSAR